MKMSDKRALVKKRQKARERELEKRKREEERLEKKIKRDEERLSKEEKRLKEQGKKLIKDENKILKDKHMLELDKEALERTRKAPVGKEKIKYDILQIFPEARKYKTTLTKKFVNRKVWKRPDPQEIKSIIPGVVISLEVKEGDHVTKGAHLMTFEAMKMMNLVLAPFDGTIKKILVNEGAKVPKGVVMLYLESDLDIVKNEDDHIATSSDLDQF